MQSIPSLLPQEDFLDIGDSAKDVFGEAGPAAPAAEPLQVVLQDRVQPRSREASVGGGRGRHGRSTYLRCLLIKVFNSQMMRFAGAVGDPCHVEAGVDFALGVRRARLQDLGFRRLRLQEADESGKADK